MAFAARVMFSSGAKWSSVMVSPNGDAETALDRVREKTNFVSQIKLIWVVQSAHKKYSTSQITQITGLSPAVLFRQEGRSRVVTNAGWDVVDAGASARHGGRRAS